MITIKELKSCLSDLENKYGENAKIYVRDNHAELREVRCVYVNDDNQIEVLMGATLKYLAEYEMIDWLRGEQLVEYINKLRKENKELLDKLKKKYGFE